MNVQHSGHLNIEESFAKKILDYAFSCDLIHPEDCGTMTHWYSRTPLQFLDAVKPGFLSQTSKSQSEETGLVWDIFDGKNLKNYQKLTDTHVKEYGRPDIFHTIGLAERTYASDRQKNIELKKFDYRKILGHIENKYPNAKTLIATWDFFFCLKPEEVRDVVNLFDPEKTILFTYFDEWVGLIDEFVDNIKNHKTPLINLKWHKKTIEAMNSVYESIATGKVVHL